ncbi:MAG: peptidylprolyl isomerase [Crenarchaeota archaeon]|nr:peptidylprolyl isomerase [Thermoproteota archaeon]MDW8034300.1 FKBP-type peptidyl-prolyl cis-trans isomerase [Nitrososphaerota archaeon]
MEPGSLILVDYTLTVKETGNVIETTIEEDAKKASIYKESEKYSPRLIHLGSKWVLESWEEELLKSEVGVEKTVEIPPEKAYGFRDPNKVKTYAARRFSKPQELIPGALVEVDNKIGVVRNISGGRVQVDFNPPLAGKTLVYRFKIVKVLEDDSEKIRYLVNRRLPEVSVEEVSVEIREETATIILPNKVLLSDGIQQIKKAVFEDVVSIIKGINTVKFIDVFTRPGEVKSAGEDKTPT